MLKMKACTFLFFLLFSTSFAHDSDSTNQNIYNQNYIDDYFPTNEDETLNVVVEITAGTNEKWEVSKPDGKLELEYESGKPRIIKYIGYPGNYGMIPGTLVSEDIGGDGDPLDVLLIGGPVMRGQIVKGKLVGILRFLDRGKIDDKLLAVLPETALDEVDDLTQLDETFPGITSIVKTWFLYYKGSEKMVFKGFGNVQEARNILNKAIKEYQGKKYYDDRSKIKSYNSIK